MASLSTLLASLAFSKYALAIQSKFPSIGPHSLHARSACRDRRCIGPIATASCILDRLPDPRGRQRHVEMCHPKRRQGIQYGMHDGWGRTDGAALANPLHADRIGRRGRLLELRANVRYPVGTRYGIVEQ